MADSSSEDGGEKSTKVDRQIKNAGLPTSGALPFFPEIEIDRKGQTIIKKASVTHGPKKGKKGYVDTRGRIWIKDRAHAGFPDHWDVQENGGRKGYTRVDSDGNILP